VNFSDVAAKRLRNIAANGARCGVYTLVHWDQRNAPPNDFVPDELRKNSVRILRGENNFHLANWREPGTKLFLNPPPPPEFATKFLHDIGEASRNSTRVEVPFEQIAPADDKIWTEETSDELRVAIGRSGATKLQYLEIGRATRQHALIAGKPVLANQRCFTSSSRTLRCGAARSRWNFISWISKRRRVQMLREPSFAARARRGHRKRPRIWLERVAARG